MTRHQLVAAIERPNQHRLQQAVCVQRGGQLVDAAEFAPRVALAGTDCVQREPLHLEVVPLWDRRISCGGLRSGVIAADHPRRRGPLRVRGPTRVLSRGHPRIVRHAAQTGLHM